MSASHVSWLLVGLLLVSGCDNLQRNGARAGGDISKAYNETRYKVSRYIYEETPPPPPVQYVPPPRPRFCYEVVSDIICYDRPHPAMHLNLVAVHGDHDYGYADYLPESVRAQEEGMAMSAIPAPPPMPMNAPLTPTFAPFEQGQSPAFSSAKTAPIASPSKSLGALPPAVAVGDAPAVAGR